MRVCDAMGTPSESVEQQCLFRWACMEQGALPDLRWMYHIANEGKRSRATGGRMRAEGLKKGVLDICLPVARGPYHALYVEMKRAEGSTPTVEQCEWMKGLEAQGACVCWCRGWEAAAEVIKRYLLHGIIYYKPTKGRGGQYHA